MLCPFLGIFNLAWKNKFRISGAIFDEGHDSQEAAFQHAVDLINADRSLLVRTRLIAHIERIPRGDSFKATKRGNTSR